MAVYDIIPTTNVKGEDIRDTLEHYGAEFSGDYNAENYINKLTSYFREDAYINMWAKYKPVWWNDNFIDIKSCYRAKYSGREKELIGLHSDGDCGVAPYNRVKDTFGATNERAELIKEASRIIWHYALPKGNSYMDAYGKEVLCPYRLGDFRGYNPKAKPPIYISDYYNRFQVELTTNKNVYIPLEVENDDPDYSLQGVDIANAGLLNLNQCEIFAALYSYNGSFMRLASSEGPIFENGEVASNFLNIDFTGAQYAKGYTIYMALRCPASDGNFYFYPIPVGDYTASMPLYADVTIEPTTSGGIENWETDIYIAPRETSDFQYFKLFYEAIEEGDALYYMMNYDGDMSMRIKMTNNGKVDTTFNISDFTISTAGKVTNRRPVRMTTDNGSNVSSIKVPAKGYTWLYLQWDDVLPFNTGETNIYNSVEVSFKVNGLEAANGALFYHYGSQGWGTF